MRVELSSGTIRGTDADGARAFLGIPYARAARFTAPEPATWDGELDATSYGPMAPQPAGEQWLRHELGQSEDCLSVNVWTPDTSGSRPVMVWIHGGAFRQGSGSGPLYDGGRLAATGDVVVVTFNYRLGALGFLSHPDLADGEGHSGNWGLLDQTEALRWVQREIASFGGDPSNVTLFGESAGGASVTLQMVMPSARGLFHKAICQSGGPFTAGADRAAALAEAMASALDTTVAGLRDVEVGRMIGSQAGQEASAAAGMLFVPVEDGNVIPRRPMDMFADGEAAPVPLVMGTNAEEFRLFAPMDPHRRNLSDEHLARRVDKLLDGGRDDVIAAYRAALRGRGMEGRNSEVWFGIAGDQFFRVPTNMVLARHAAHHPTYGYLFDWRSPAMGGFLGACHALEIPFVFGTHDRPLINVWTGAGTVDGADELSGQMMRAWLAFAHSGDPTTPSLAWPCYDTTSEPIMIFGPRCGVEDGPASEIKVLEAHIDTDRMLV